MATKTEELKERAAKELEGAGAKAAAQLRSLDLGPVQRALDAAGRLRDVQDNPVAKFLGWLSE